MLSPSPPPTDPDVTEAAVIEFGSEPAPRRGLGLLDDRRVVPLAAALAAVAAFVSLVSEWQVTTVDGTMFGGDTAGARTVPADLSDLGASGAGYLIALFPLVTAVVLTMFGPAAGQRYARLAGLSVGGTLLGLLLTMVVTLGEQSRIISRLYIAQTDGGELIVGYGRGLWCALFAVVAALAALYLAGRHITGQRPAGADEPAADEPAATRSWRRPRGNPADPRSAEPFELTVSSAPPFTPADDDRHLNPRSGRTGISE